MGCGCKKHLLMPDVDLFSGRRWNESMSQIWNPRYWLEDHSCRVEYGDRPLHLQAWRLLAMKSLLEHFRLLSPSAREMYKSFGIHGNKACRLSILNPSVTSSLLGLLDTLFFLVKSHFSSPLNNPLFFISSAHGQVVGSLWNDSASSKHKPCSSCD